MDILGKSRLVVTLLVGLMMVSCSNDDTDEDLVGNWIKKSSFDGPARSSATSFVIGSFAYVATGYTGDEYLKDLWAYDSEGDYWQQKADLSGVGRSAASGFELNAKGYLGLGYDGSNKLKDFHEYDPIANIWTQKTDFAGTARYSAVGFQAANKAYFGTGYDGNYLKDFYQYTPSNDTWTLVNGFSGNKRRGASTFVIDNKVYLGLGVNSGTYQVDFWMFDPATDTWTRKNDIDQDTSDDYSYNDEYVLIRSSASAFSMNGLGYIGCGENTRTIWEYDPSSDIWSEKTALEGSARTDAIGFAIKERGFILLGRTGSSYFDDVWEFKPFDTQSDDDN
jgi:N-acetylneuraminic acid mutarotase